MTTTDSAEWTPITVRRRDGSEITVCSAEELQAMMSADEVAEVLVDTDENAADAPALVVPDFDELMAGHGEPAAHAHLDHAQFFQRFVLPPIRAYGLSVREFAQRINIGHKRLFAVLERGVAPTPEEFRAITDGVVRLKDEPVPTGDAAMPSSRRDDLRNYHRHYIAHRGVPVRRFARLAGIDRARLERLFSGEADASDKEFAQIRAALHQLDAEIMRTHAKKRQRGKEPKVLMDLPV